MLRYHSCTLDDKNLDDVKSCNTIKDLLTVIYAYYSKGASVK